MDINKKIKELYEVVNKCGLFHEGANDRYVTVYHARYAAYHIYILRDGMKFDVDNSFSGKLADVVYKNGEFISYCNNTEVEKKIQSEMSEHIENMLLRAEKEILSAIKERTEDLAKRNADMVTEEELSNAVNECIKVTEEYNAFLDVDIATKVKELWETANSCNLCDKNGVYTAYTVYIPENSRGTLSSMSITPNKIVFTLKTFVPDTDYVIWENGEFSKVGKSWSVGGAEFIANNAIRYLSRLEKELYDTIKREIDRRTEVINPEWKIPADELHEAVDRYKTVLQKVKDYSTALDELWKIIKNHDLIEQDTSTGREVYAFRHSNICAPIAGSVNIRLFSDQLILEFEQYGSECIVYKNGKFEEICNSELLSQVTMGFEYYLKALDNRIQHSISDKIHKVQESRIDIPSVGLSSMIAFDTKASNNSDNGSESLKDSGTVKEPEDYKSAPVHFYDRPKFRMNLDDDDDEC